MRFAAPLLLPVALLAAVASGCGASPDTSTTTAPGSEATEGRRPFSATTRSCPGERSGIESLRVTEVGCGVGRRVAGEWSANPGCSAGDSRSGCTIRGYRCLAVAGGRGVAISCARPGRSISFLAAPRH